MPLIPERTRAQYILFPAVAMLLGWGLRGYIGGGPFGAMIPGCYVALCLSLLLGHSMETAARVALFGAIGIGFGGDMTYGQTLGFLREADTVYWGLIGVTIKGGIWGLLGGAMLGIALMRPQYDRKSLLIAFALAIVAFYAGVKLINEPKLIYFSDRLDKPREECWAGLLFAAVALLGFLRTRDKSPLPLRFALWGLLGGAAGFGGGSLWMVAGPHLPVDQKWFGWWKMMEYSFGFIFGAALGTCAYRNRERLTEAREDIPPEGSSLAANAGVIVLIAALFFVFPLLVDALGGEEADSALATAVTFLFGSLYNFIVFGMFLIAIAMPSVSAAWQVAISLTFFHAMYDLNDDMLSHNGFEVSQAILIPLLAASTIAVIVAVSVLHRREWPIHRLFLLIVWTCYAVACAKTFLIKDYFVDGPDGRGSFGFMLSDHPSIIVVQTIFTVSAIATTVYIARIPRERANG